MNKELKDFIIKYEEEINNNEWDKVYDNIPTTFRGDLTSILLETGINPLPYMNEIPEYFAKGSQVSITQIPENIKSIGDYAFSNCRSLTSITIPNSVKNIRYRTFSDCTNLTSITIPNSVTSIGSSAFSNCISLTSIEIPDSVTSIGSHAFNDCSSLTGITIPSSVTSIGWGAFSGCPYLKLLRYKGTRAEWENIQKSSQWSFKSSIKEIECTDGIISLK